MPFKKTRVGELLRGRVGPGARSLQLWPAGLWRRFPRLQAGHPGAGTAGHGAGADRGRRADGKLVRGAAEEGGVQSSAPHCVGQGRGFRWVVSGRKPGKRSRRGPSPRKARGNTQQVGGRRSRDRRLPAPGTARGVGASWGGDPGRAVGRVGAGRGAGALPWEA